MSHSRDGERHKKSNPLSNICSLIRLKEWECIIWIFMNKFASVQMCTLKSNKTIKRKTKIVLCALAGTIATAFHTVNNFFLELLPFLFFGETFFLCTPSEVIIVLCTTALCMPHLRIDTARVSKQTIVGATFSYLPLKSKHKVHVS